MKLLVDGFLLQLVRLGPVTIPCWKLRVLLKVVTGRLSACFCAFVIDLLQVLEEPATSMEEEEI